MGLCGSSRCGCGLTVGDGLDLTGSGEPGDPWSVWLPDGAVTAVKLDGSTAGAGDVTLAAGWGQPAATFQRLTVRRIGRMVFLFGGVRRTGGTISTGTSPTVATVASGSRPLNPLWLSVLRIRPDGSLDLHHTGSVQRTGTVRVDDDGGLDIVNNDEIWFNAVWHVS